MESQVSVPTGGFVESGFEPVREAFLRNFAEHGEIGASVAVVLDGRTVVDLWGGWVDGKRTSEWTKSTISPFFSASKGITAICAHILADQGKLDFDAPVSRYWPEFAQAGKESLPVRYVMTHQAGLAGIFQDLPDGAALNWEVVIRALESEPPNWEPGTQMGYHGQTFGYLVGEIVRRISGLSIGQFMDQVIAKPLGVDLFLGVPEEHHGEIAEFMFPAGITSRADHSDPRYGDKDSLWWRAAALAEPPLNTRRVTDAEWRLAEMPSSNVHGNARAFARIYGALARGGELDGIRLLSPSAVDALSIPAVEVEEDYVIKNGVKVRRSLGFMLPVPEQGDPQGPRAFGHNGAGGQVGWADPDTKVGFGYTTNLFQGYSQSPDQRGYRLYRALNECLVTLSL